MSAPRVVVAAGDILTGAGLRVALLDAGFEVVAEARDALSAVAGAAQARPDLVLVASDLPGGGGLGAVRSIAAADPHVRVVVLTESPSGDELVAAVLAGASGYLSTEGDQGRLACALRGVLDGEVALPRRYTERLLDELRGRRSRRAALDAQASRPITDREWEVLELLAAGAATGEIARRLGVAEVTVRRHASSAAAKLGVPDRAAAVRLLSRSAQ